MQLSFSIARVLLLSYLTSNNFFLLSTETYVQIITSCQMNLNIEKKRYVVNTFMKRS